MMNPEDLLARMMGEFGLWRFATLLAAGPVKTEQNIALMRPGADFGAPSAQDLLFSIPIWEEGAKE